MPLCGSALNLANMMGGGVVRTHASICFLIKANMKEHLRECNFADDENIILHGKGLAGWPKSTFFLQRNPCFGKMLQQLQKLHSLCFHNFNGSLISFDVTLVRLSCTAPQIRLRSTTARDVSFIIVLYCCLLKATWLVLKCILLAYDMIWYDMIWYDIISYHRRQSCEGLGVRTLAKIVSENSGD